MPFGYLRKLFQREAELLKLRREVAQLQTQLEQLQEQNTNMRAGMRRCVTCDYRLESRQRRGESHLKQADFRN